MGRRGPKPTPTAVLEQRGSWLAKTRDAEPQPDPLPEVPPCPKGLTGEAGVIWRESAARMVGVGTLTEEDLRTFERYCRTYALWKKKAIALEKADDISENAAKALGHLDNQLRRLEAALGKSPADRANLRVPPKKDKDAPDPFAKPKLQAS